MWRWGKQRGGGAQAAPVRSGDARPCAVGRRSPRLQLGERGGAGGPCVLCHESDPESDAHGGRRLPPRDVPRPHRGRAIQRGGRRGLLLDLRVLRKFSLDQEGNTRRQTRVGVLQVARGGGVRHRGVYVRRQGGEVLVLGPDQQPHHALAVGYERDCRRV